MPSAPFWLDHLLFGLLAVLFPLRAQTFGYRRLTQAEPGRVPSVRRSLYRQAMVIQWTLALITVGLWWATRRAWGTLGLMPAGTLRLTLGLAAVAVIGFLLAAQRRRAMRDPEALDSVREHLVHLERMMPRTDAELRQFGLLSVTAGVCEELLYRGYLFWYLGHYLGPLPGAALAALVFGIGHAYQGFRGVVTTTLVGMALGALYLLCGSLLPGMLAHALTDYHSGILARAAFASAPAGIGAAEPETAEREAAEPETAELEAAESTEPPA